MKVKRVKPQPSSVLVFGQRRRQQARNRDIAVTRADKQRSSRLASLERAVRDGQAAVKHIAMTPSGYIVAGRIALGLDAGTARILASLPASRDLGIAVDDWRFCYLALPDVRIPLWRRR